ncbi:MAG: hypothetical protein EA351_08285 [Gemmatimonadales bacterium]|nr:MAG: hypothetical protein EA351_08285 [Gemmatimonadales bacterium]
MERSKAGKLVQGVIAGLMGAAVLAFWFLVVDLAAGEPFRTPAMIAGALFGLDDLVTSPLLLGVFSLVHFGAFAIVGAGAALAIAQLERSPNLPFGFVVGFVLFNGVFFGSAAVTGIDVVGRLGWVEVLVGNLLAGIVLVNWLHLSGVARSVEWRDALKEGTVLREGLIAGVASGFVVATWFLVVDTFQGRPFFTPSALGAVLFDGATDLAEVEISLWLTAAYTPVHYAIFIPIGILAAAIAQQAERQPPILIGAILLFVAFEAFALGIIAVAAEFLLGPLAWWNIALGNLAGVLTIVGYLWKKHPRLVESLGTDRIETPA